MTDLDMARNRSKKALYEVMSRSRSNSNYGKTIEPLRQDGSTENRQENADSTSPGSNPQIVPGWPARPKLVQFNAGRIEISMPYQLAIAILLGIVLVVLVFFRLGQASFKQETADLGTEIPRNVIEKSAENENSSSKIEKNENTVTKGRNNIVLKQFARRADLEQAQKYFGTAGIETTIISRAGTYFLISKNTYDNPGKPGTDGYKALKKIVSIGADYKAPQGYESFGPIPFNDAYGKRFDN